MQMAIKDIFLPLVGEPDAAVAAIDKCVAAAGGFGARVTAMAVEEDVKVFEAYVDANAIDLLIMGAHRHSRLNEMVWGGATKTVITRPPCWVMMSH
jgi:nucleotide-binding universal stress UspA family protein